MTTDTSEKGLEALIVESLIEGAGYATGDSKDFDRDHAGDLAKLFDFLKGTSINHAFRPCLSGARLQ
jgi:type I restriction enzyme R subunit